MTLRQQSLSEKFTSAKCQMADYQNFKLNISPRNHCQMPYHSIVLRSWSNFPVQKIIYQGTQDREGRCQVLSSFPIKIKSFILFTFIVSNPGFNIKLIIKVLFFNLSLSYLLSYYLLASSE